MNKTQIQLLMRGYLNKVFSLNEGLDNSFITPELLNGVLEGYLKCALWTEEERLNDEYNSEHPNPDAEYDEMDGAGETDMDKLIKLQSKMNSKSFSHFVDDDIDIDSKIQAYLDIKLFVKLAGVDAVKEAIEENGVSMLGMDIWFTRNGHGSGFFDHNYDNETRLIEAGRQLKGVDLYISDDLRLVFSNA